MSVDSNNLCSHLVYRLFYLDNMLVKLLQQFFSRPDENLIPALRHLRWVPDSASGVPINDPNAIRIEHWATWNPGNAGNIPAILVRGNDMALIKIGISNRHMSPNVGSLTGEEHYTKAAAGSHRLLTIARNANEAQLLAYAAADHIQAFSRQICDAIQLKVLEVSSVGMPKRLKELPHTFAAPVNIEYGFFHTWAVSPAAPRLNRVRLDMKTTL